MTGVELHNPLPDEGVAVPLRATFIGIARVPLIALAKNNLSALLRVYEDQLEYKVLFRRERPYSDIRRIELLTTLATRNVEFVWRDSVLTFAANVRDDAWRAALLGLLRRKGAPLGPAALALIDGPGAGGT